MIVLMILATMDMALMILTIVLMEHWIGFGFMCHSPWCQDPKIIIFSESEFLPRSDLIMFFTCTIALYPPPCTLESVTNVVQWFEHVYVIKWKKL